MSRWSTRQRSSVLREASDDNWVIFLEGSGMTHLVDHVSGEVLSFLAPAMRTPDEIRAFVGKLLGDDTITFERIRKDWLLPLTEIGLLEEVA